MFYVMATLQPLNPALDLCARCEHPPDRHGVPCRYPYVFMDCGCPEWAALVCAECREQPGQCRCPSWMLDDAGRVVGFNQIPA